MKDICTFETAVKLKEAGFPQPDPEVGQVWYNDLYPLMIIEWVDCSFRLEALEHGPEYSHEILDWFADDPKNSSPNFSGEASVFSPIYAPTATDILRAFTPEDWVRAWNSNPLEMKAFLEDVEKIAAAWLELKRQEKQRSEGMGIY